MKTKRFRFALGLAAGLAGTSARAVPSPASRPSAAVWNLELPRGKTATTTVTVLNRCVAPHTFSVAVDPPTGFLTFPEATSPVVAPGKASPWPPTWTRGHSTRVSTGSS
jgi:hypothetical protein